MSPHQRSSYKDGYFTVVYCSVCGRENPAGDCHGATISDTRKQYAAKAMTREDIKFVSGLPDDVDKFK